METPDNMRYVQVSDNSSWHLIEDTYINLTGLPTVKTRCGMTRNWDQTFLDRLPGGDETACENCLLLLAGDVDEPKKVKSAK